MCDFYNCFVVRVRFLILLEVSSVLLKVCGNRCMLLWNVIGSCGMRMLICSWVCE